MVVYVFVKCWLGVDVELCRTVSICTMSRNVVHHANMFAGVFSNWDVSHLLHNFCYFVLYVGSILNCCQFLTNFATLIPLLYVK